MSLCILGSVALCTVIFLGIRARFVPQAPKNQTVTKAKGKAVSVYVDDGTGVYRANEDGTFPTTGYVLNTELSGCSNGGVLSQNPDKTIRLSVSGSDQCHVYFDKESLPLLSTILDKANDSSITDYNSGNKGEMFAFDHEATGQVSDWTVDELRDYRYIGSSPNNYITFNDETWRIIGVFTVEVEGQSKPQQLVKIIRDASIGNLQWNSAGSNEWTNGSLHTLLNSGDYYNQTGSYASTSANKGLGSTVRNQIAKVKFYLGGSSTETDHGGPSYYAFERGMTTCATTGKCSGQTRETNIMQSVGLMYPSDYVYTYANGVDEGCYLATNYCLESNPLNGWLFDSRILWTQSPSANYDTLVFGVTDSGSVNAKFNVINPYDLAYQVRPVVYLTSDILIEGTGEQGDPYTIKASS